MDGEGAVSNLARWQDGKIWRHLPFNGSRFRMVNEGVIWWSHQFSVASYSFLRGSVSVMPGPGESRLFIEAMDPDCVEVARS